MKSRIGDLLAQRAREEFIGRSAELESLLSILEGEPQVVFIHGIAGIGKSTLIEAFAEKAHYLSSTVIRLDCRGIEPTERGFLQELNVALRGYSGEMWKNLGQATLTLEQAAERLGTLGNKVVLSLDNYEVFRLMDTWLRQIILRLLPENVRVIISGRDRPISSWYVSPGWKGVFRSLALEPLSESEAKELLILNGVKPEKIGRILEFASGHPLALKLAANAVIEMSGSNITFSNSRFQQVVEELTGIYISDIQDPLTRQSLYASSVTRRATVSLLKAMLPNIPADEMFEQLRNIPFIESKGDGLHMHDVVKQAVAGSFQAIDPNRYQSYRRAAWRQLNKEIRNSSQLNLWRYTADLLYLIENPVVRDAFFPSGSQEFIVEPARSDDGKAIEEISCQHESASASDCIINWWQRNPHTFRVVRAEHNNVVGFYFMFDPLTVSTDDLKEDPIVKQWQYHLLRNPLQGNQRALFIRRWLSREHGETPSQVQAACWLDMKRSYMEMRPYLRRVYLTLHDLAPYAPVAAKLGFKLIENAETFFDEVSYHSAVLDFGPLSVDGWLAGLVADEMGIEEDDLLDVDSHELVLSDRRVKLTKLEFDVFLYLYERENKPVTRASLIEGVWGYKHTGSNVIEAVVRSLRKKLGERASDIETLRDVGYRFRRASANN